MRTPILPIIALILLAGCTGSADPTQAAEPLPLEATNETDGGLTVTLRVADAASGAELWHGQTVLNPGETRDAGTLQLAPGQYVLSAETGELSRHVTVDLDGSSVFYRFAVHDDVIAFQRG